MVAVVNVYFDVIYVSLGKEKLCNPKMSGVLLLTSSNVCCLTLPSLVLNVLLLHQW